MVATTDLSIDAKDFSNGLRQELPAVADDILFARSFAGLNSGNARPLQAGDAFAGVVIRRVDNTGGAAGDKLVELESRVQLQLAVTGSGSSAPGDLVYASDDQTATMTSTSNSLIGRLEQQVSGTTWWVRIFTPGEAGQFTV